MGKYGIICNPDDWRIEEPVPSGNYSEVWGLQAEVQGGKRELPCIHQQPLGCHSCESLYQQISMFSDWFCSTYRIFSVYNLHAEQIILSFNQVGAAIHMVWYWRELAKWGLNPWSSIEHHDQSCDTKQNILCHHCHVITVSKIYEPQTYRF